MACGHRRLNRLRRLVPVGHYGTDDYPALDYCCAREDDFAVGCRNLLFSDILMKEPGNITLRTARFSKYDICLYRYIAKL